MKGAGFIVCLSIVLCSMVRSFSLEAPGLVICRCMLRHEDCLPRLCYRAQRVCARDACMQRCLNTQRDYVSRFRMRIPELSYGSHTAFSLIAGNKQAVKRHKPQMCQQKE